MTTNQRHAAALAEGVCRGAINPASLSDEEWTLLLLAAGTNAVCAPPVKVARVVLERAGRGSGYFLPGATPPRAASEADLPALERRPGFSIYCFGAIARRGMLWKSWRR